jgi:guanyl-specific ribonuclease Sa
MRLAKNQRGFTGIEIVLVVVVAAMIGFVIFKAYEANQTAKAPAAEQSKTSSDVPAAPSITSTSDLNAAETTLNQIDPGANTHDTAELDSNLAAF